MQEKLEKLLKFKAEGQKFWESDHGRGQSWNLIWMPKLELHFYGIWCKSLLLKYRQENILNELIFFIRSENPFLLLL